MRAEKGIVRSKPPSVSRLEAEWIIETPGEGSEQPVPGATKLTVDGRSTEPHFWQGHSCHTTDYNFHYRQACYYVFLEIVIFYIFC